MPELPDGQVDGAKITIVRNPQTQVNDIEQGKYDWMQNPPPADRYQEVKEKYEGTQFEPLPTISTYYFWMNTQKAAVRRRQGPPGRQLRGRPAKRWNGSTRARSKARSRSCRRACPGYKKLDLYPYDIAKAKEMIKEANPSDMDITVWTDTECPNNEAGEYYEGVLKELGFNAKLKIINADNYFTIIGNQTTPDLDTGWSDWFEDYPHPNDFFQPLLSGESILPTNNGNFANIDEPDREQGNHQTRRRTARSRTGSGLRRTRQEIHGRGALGAVRHAHAVDLRLRATSTSKASSSTRRSSST